jgi:hypothetical protein
MFPVKKNMINLLLLVNIKILFNKKIEFVKFVKLETETQNSSKLENETRVSSFSSFWPVKFTDVTILRLFFLNFWLNSILDYN